MGEIEGDPAHCFEADYLLTLQHGIEGRLHEQRAQARGADPELEANLVAWQYAVLDERDALRGQEAGVEAESESGSDPDRGRVIGFPTWNATWVPEADRKKDSSAPS